MRMTIDESINQILDSLLGEKAYLLNYSDRVALTEALNTMLKYQKIAMAIRKYDVAWEFHHMKPTIDKIREVVEDEKND